MNYFKTKRNCIILLLSVLLVCFCCFAATGQTTSKPATVSKVTAKVSVAPKTASSIVDTFFKKYKEMGADSAIEYLFGTNKLLSDLPQVLTLRSKLDSLSKASGKYEGKELISQKTATPSLVYFSYLVKFEYQPFRFTFMFYKPQNNWELYRFKYDDQMDSELEEAGKINNKRP